METFLSLAACKKCSQDTTDMQRYLSALPSVSSLIRRLSSSCIVYTAGSNVTAEELAALRGVNQDTLFERQSRC